MGKIIKAEKGGGGIESNPKYTPVLFLLLLLILDNIAMMFSDNISLYFRCV